MTDTAPVRPYSAETESFTDYVRRLFDDHGRSIIFIAEWNGGLVIDRGPNKFSAWIREGDTAVLRNDSYFHSTLLTPPADAFEELLHDLGQDIFEKFQSRFGRSPSATMQPKPI